jgi:hypothetical protein
MLPRDAFFARSEDVKPQRAVGRVSAELVTSDQSLGTFRVVAAS